MSTVQIYTFGLCYLSCCAPKELPVEEVKRSVNGQHPTGLDHGWELSDDKTFKSGEPMPAPCNDAPNERIHYLFVC